LKPRGLIGLVVLYSFLLPGAAGAAEWFVASGAKGNGTSQSPFGSIQAALNAAAAGDTIVVRAGTYRESLRTVRNGAAGRPITIRAERGRGSVTVTALGRVVRVDHSHHVFEGLILDGQYGTSRLAVVNSGGSYFVLRDSEVRRSSRNCVDLAAPVGVLIEKSLIQRCLNWTDGRRRDAHGIAGGAVRDLTIRDVEIHTFSGDAVQIDPGRRAPGWDRVVIENCRFWLGPLERSENGFPAGMVPGENAIDTKTLASAPRAALTIRDTLAWGFRGGTIANMAAFNLKENVDVVIDRVTVWDSEIAFRLRGGGSDTSRGALVRLQNAVIHSVAIAVRYEDNIQNLRVWNSTFGRSVSRPFVNAQASASQVNVRNLVMLGSGLPREASHSSNLAVASDSFVGASRHDYRLVATSPAVDKGVTLGGVPDDRAGISRPRGKGYDVGAYEYCAINCGGEDTPTEPGTSPSASGALEVVLRTWESQVMAGNWSVMADVSAADGLAMTDPNYAASTVWKPAPAPAHYFELTFMAEANRPYRLWIRGKAERDRRSNNSAHVQFSNTVDGTGAPIYRIGTTSAVTYVLEECDTCGLSGWGWRDGGYNGTAGPLIRFATTGLQRVRIQTRQDGLSIDQIVLSAQKYLNVSPGAAREDRTILPR
jgi:hypothetical protein